MLSKDDTIVFGAIPTPLADATDDVEELQHVFGIADGWIRYDAHHQPYRTPDFTGEELAEELQVPVHLIEVHQRMTGLKSVSYMVMSLT